MLEPIEVMLEQDLQKFTIMVPDLALEAISNFFYTYVDSSILVAIVAIICATLNDPFDLGID